MYPPYRPREWRTAGGRAGGTPASLPLPPPAASSSLTSSSIPPGEKVIFLLCCLSLFTLLGRRNEGDLPASCYPNQLEGGRPESRAWRAGSVTDIARRLTSDAASIERAIVLFSSTQVACATTLKIRTEAPRCLLQTADLWRQSAEEGTFPSLP